MVSEKLRLALSSGRVEHPLTAPLHQLSTDFLVVNPFNSLFKFPDQPQRSSFHCLSEVHLRDLFDEEISSTAR